MIGGQLWTASHPCKAVLYSYTWPHWEDQCLPAVWPFTYVVFVVFVARQQSPRWLVDSSGQWVIYARQYCTVTPDHTERTRVCQQYDHSLMLYLLFLLLGNSHQGDWWTALDSESSMQGSTVQLHQTTLRGPEFASSMAIHLCCIFCC